MKLRVPWVLKNELTADDISSAQAVILATDIMIENQERFDDIPKIQVPVQLALKDPKSIFEKEPS